MRRIRIKKEVKIGAFALVAILVLYWGVNFIKGTDLIRGTHTYYALYDQVSGLQPSSPIVIQGYKVGVVKNMIFEPHKSKKITLELSVKSRFRIPEDSRARIFSDGLMGGKAIEIEMGTSINYLSQGDTLSSQWDKDFLEVAGSEFESIKQKLTAMMSQMTILLENVNGLLAGNTEHITTTLGNLAQISGSLNTVISTESSDLQAIINNMNALSKTLKDSSPKIDRIVTNMDEFSTSLKEADVKQAVDELSGGLSHLNTTLSKLNEGEGTAGKLLNDTALYDSLTQAATNLNYLLEDVKAHPKRYVNISVFGGGKDK